MAGISLVLAFGFDVKQLASVPASLVSVSFTQPAPTPSPPPPPPPPPPLPEPGGAPTGAPAPAAIRNRASPVIAPPVPIVIVPPPPVIAAPVPDDGGAPARGASDRPGPGQGAGGIGDGLGGGGAGGYGTGTGSGRGDGSGRGETPPRQIRGRLSSRDIPSGLIAAGSEASVGVRYTVLPDGRTANCIVTQSSGIPALDPVPCRLILERFRFRPARDRFGRPVSSEIVESHTWVEEPPRPGR